MEDRGLQPLGLLHPRTTVVSSRKKVPMCLLKQKPVGSVLLVLCSEQTLLSIETGLNFGHSTFYVRTMCFILSRASFLECQGKFYSSVHDHTVFAPCCLSICIFDFEQRRHHKWEAVNINETNIPHKNCSPIQMRKNHQLIIREDQKLQIHNTRQWSGELLKRLL